jgi:D-alanine transaminase
MPRYSYVNGRYVPHADAAVHIEDRGFQFADGVYEVFSLVDGHCADEAGHLDRLERSLRELRITMPMPRRALKLVVREFARRNRLKNAYVYIQVSRGAAPRDFKFPKGVRPTLVITHLGTATFDMAARKKAVKKAVTVPDIRWKRREAGRRRQGRLRGVDGG